MKCQVCHLGEGQYKCPACGMMTCSVACVKEHKKQTGCTGVAPRSTFVPMAQLNENTLMRDCELIDKTQSKVVWSEEKLPHSQKTPKWQKSLKKACIDRGITIFFLPSDSSRSQSNTTRFDSSSGSIIWCCRWRFFSAPNQQQYERIVSGISNDTPLAQTFQAIIETSPNDYVAHISPSTSAFLLVAEGAEGGGHFRADPSLGIGDNLFSKTVIEYPTIDVIEDSAISQWKIVTELEVRRFEEFKEKPASSTEKTLPEYKDIKKALKLDIIRSVNEEKD